MSSMDRDSLRIRVTIDDQLLSLKNHGPRSMKRSW